MVVIGFRAASPTGVMQERRGDPPTKTVQAPHCPSPQPYLLPTRSRSSRKTLSRLVPASTSTEYFTPLMSSSVTFDMSNPRMAVPILRLFLQRVRGTYRSSPPEHACKIGADSGECVRASRKSREVEGMSALESSRRSVQSSAVCEGNDEKFRSIYDSLAGQEPPRRRTSGQYLFPTQRGGKSCPPRCKIHDSRERVVSASVSME